MTRPKPKKSQLSGLTPITPPETKASDPLKGDKGDKGDNAPVAPLEKMSFRVRADFADEIRSAFALAMARGDARSLSEWVIDAIETKLVRERAEFNGGEKFPPRPKGTIATGRR